MNEQYSANIAEIMYDLYESLPPALYEKLGVVIKHQDNINAIIRKRRKIMRQLKAVLPPAHYHKASMVLDIKEAEMPEPDRITLLENRALHHFLKEGDFDYTQWLNNKDAIELMMLQNEEARAFQVDEPWDPEYIKYRKQHDLVLTN